jgi:hypothetical protein
LQAVPELGVSCNSNKALCLRIQIPILILTGSTRRASMRASLEKEVVQKIWIVVNDRERWLTVKVKPLM